MGFSLKEALGGGLIGGMLGGAGGLFTGGALGGLFGGESQPAPPDYSPAERASKYAADLGYKTGQETLAEAKRQYEENKKISDPVVAAQLGLMKQQQTQGDEYYNYMLKNQRPLEEAMNKEAMAAGSQAQQDEYAARGIADTTSGYARAQNAAMRQGIRYGYSPERMAAGAAGNATNQAVAQAGAANAGRMQAQNLGWARKMDTAGLYRGLSGASTGAYGAASNAGSSAINSQMTPGQTYMSGMNGGYGLQMQGAGMQSQGLTGVLNAQTNAYGSQMQNYSSPWDRTMGLIQAGATAYASDPRVKENIEMVGKTVFGLNLYEFNYLWDLDTRYRGVMSTEVEKVMPEAVSSNGVYDVVDYSMLGIKMEKVEVTHV